MQLSLHRDTVISVIYDFFYISAVDVRVRSPSVSACRLLYRMLSLITLRT